MSLVPFAANGSSYSFYLRLGGTAVADHAERSGLESSSDIVENVIVDDLGIAMTGKSPGRASLA
jgi:hypothetical protein